MRTWLLPFAFTLSASTSNSLSLHISKSTRRKWLFESSRSAAAAILSTQFSGAAFADDEVAAYSNPNIPDAPEERSGLIVLRVAEVAQFQGENILIEHTQVKCTFLSRECPLMQLPLGRENLASNTQWRHQRYGSNSSANRIWHSDIAQELQFGW
jgi:hypothetical protein